MTEIINDIKVFKPNYRDAEEAHIPNMTDYKKIYDKSVKDPDGFWAEQAERLDWIKKWRTVSDNNFTEAKIKWYEGGKLNVSYNCLDRHIEAGFGNQTALI